MTVSTHLCDSTNRCWYCKTVPLSYTARTRSVLVAMLYIKVFIESRGAAGRGRCIINLCRSTSVQLIMNPHISQRRSPPQNSLHSGSVFLLRHLRNLERRYPWRMRPETIKHKATSLNHAQSAEQKAQTAYHHLKHLRPPYRSLTKNEFELYGTVLQYQQWFVESYKCVETVIPKEQYG